MDASTNGGDVPVRRADRGRGVDAVAEMRRLSEASERETEALSPARVAPPAEIVRIQLAALIRIEAQNEAIIGLLTEIRDQGRASRKA